MYRLGEGKGLSHSATLSLHRSPLPSLNFSSRVELLVLILLDTAHPSSNQRLPPELIWSHAILDDALISEINVIRSHHSSRNQTFGFP